MLLGLEWLSVVASNMDISQIIQTKSYRVVIQRTILRMVETFGCLSSTE